MVVALPLTFHAECLESLLGLPFYPDISIYILKTILFTFPLVLIRRIRLTIKLLRLVIISFVFMILMNDLAVVL